MRLNEMSDDAIQQANWVYDIITQVKNIDGVANTELLPLPGGWVLRILCTRNGINKSFYFNIPWPEKSTAVAANLININELTNINETIDNYFERKLKMKPEIGKLAKQAGFSFWNKEPWQPDGASIDWGSNYDYELEKFYELINGEKPTEAVEIAMGAVYDFTSYLTSRDGALVVGHQKSAIPIAIAVSEWAAFRKVHPTVKANTVFWKNYEYESKPVSTHVEFFRYVRPIDHKTGHVDSSKGVCFYIVMDYFTRTIRVSSSVCNGDNFSKQIAKDIAWNKMHHQKEYIIFTMDDFAKSDQSLVNFIHTELLNYSGEYPPKQAILKQMSDM